MGTAATDLNKSATKRLRAITRLLPCSVLRFGDAVRYAFRSHYALRAGKFWEATYSIFLELRYWWCYWFQSSSKLVVFKGTVLWRYSSECPLTLPNLAATLRLRSFSVVESPTKWLIISETSEGVIFGATHNLPDVLQRADNLLCAPKELFKFNSRIFCVFISSRDWIFVATKGTVYLSKNGGTNFAPVIQLSDPESTVWHNHGIDETPQGLVIGEYGNIFDTTWNFWKPQAYLYVTHDDGENWIRHDYLLRTGAKHLHLVRYSRRFARLLLTDGDKRKRSYWVDLIDQMRPQDFKKARFDCFSLGGGHTGFAETENVTLLGTDYRIGSNSIIYLRSSEDSTARMLPRPYRHSPVLNMCSIRNNAGTITFAYLYGSLCGRCRNALIYSDDDGESWCPLIEFDRDAQFEIANSQQGPSGALVVFFHNARTDENRTFILTATSQLRAA
jgi:hypothetical protein